MVIAPGNLGRLGFLGLGRTATTSDKGGASIYAPFPAPSGWRWQFLTEDGFQLSDGASKNKMVELRKVAA